MTEPHRAAPVPVVAAVVRKDDRYLLGLRPRDKRHGGLWEFPGGKVHEGESRLDAATRELSEELGVQVTSMGPRLFAARDDDSPFSIEFFEVVVAGTPVAHEHEQIGWFSIPELRAMPLAPADARFVAELTREA